MPGRSRLILIARKTFALLRVSILSLLHHQGYYWAVWASRFFTTRATLVKEVHQIDLFTTRATLITPESDEIRLQSGFWIVPVPVLHCMTICQASDRGILWLESNHLKYHDHATVQPEISLFEDATILKGVSISVVAADMWESCWSGILQVERGICVLTRISDGRGRHCKDGICMLTRISDGRGRHCKDGIAYAYR